MKKISTFLIVAAMAFSFAACGGAKQEGEAGTTPETEEVENVTSDVTEETSGNVVDQYISLVDKYAELMVKASEGDANAAEEAMKITQELGTLSQNEEFMAEIGKEENMKKFQEAQQKMADAAQQIAAK
ncbi:MAG: hypothetical protein LUG18_12235 [Candidatus Azobacteroides sp.]|nr:hypothetical protein [Candidatus Azobacteroides sp.]